MRLIDQIRDHGSIVQRLIKSKHSNQCHHALLFHGAKGIGKSLSALAFCQGIMCEDPEKAPCGHCNPCRKVAEDIHPDVLKISAEGKSQTVKIASIRNIQTFLSKTKNEGSCAFVLIQDADTMYPDAQNALLKVLEEPSQDVYFILIADSTENLLETVLSRCQTVVFKTLSAESLMKILFDHGFSEAESGPLIRLAEGSPGKAIHIGKNGIDQLVPSLIELLEQIGGRNIVSDSFFGADKERDLIILDLIVMLLRDVMSVLTGAGEIRYFPQYQDSLQRLALQHSLESIEHMMRVVSDAQHHCRNSYNSKLTINSMLTDIGISIT